MNANNITALFDFFMVRCSICCSWVREVGSGAGLVWHAWFGGEIRLRCGRWGGAVAVGVWSLSLAAHLSRDPTRTTHTRHPPRRSLSLSSCEQSLVSRFLSCRVSYLLSVVHLSPLVCPVLFLPCYCPLSLSCLVCVFFSVCPSLCPSLCLSVSLSVTLCLLVSACVFL